MMIQVKGYLTLRQSIPEQQVDLQQPNATLRDLLLQLTQRCQEPALVELIDQGAGKRRIGLAVLVNGIHYSHLPDGLETVLTDGDQIAIFPPIAGG